jgi:sulfite oxidase
MKSNEGSWSIQEVPVNSSLVQAKEKEGADQVRLEGYAISGGGRGILRVDVSTDNGQTWTPAQIQPRVDPSQPKVNTKQDPYKSWAWTQWYLEVPKRHEMDVVVRAVDVGCNMQPEKLESVYNERGVLNTAWQRVKLRFQ